jgi:hypothetical protein
MTAIMPSQWRGRGGRAGVDLEPRAPAFLVPSDLAPSDLAHLTWPNLTWPTLSWPNQARASQV